MTTLNLGILAHVDAGKTTLTERLLHHAGVIDRVGSVDAGTTQTDSLDLERQRGITIKSAVVSFVVDDLTINLIDTPGHPDFIAEVDRVLGVLDGVVLVVSAVEGVQAQTRVLIRALQRLQLPTLIFANKIDRRGARTDELIREIGDRLGVAVIGMGEVSELGTPTAGFAPFSRTDTGFCLALTEVLAERDDALLASFVDGLVPSYEELSGRLAEQVARCQVHPVYFGSAATGAGVATLVGAVQGLLPGAAPDSADCRSGLVFKVARAAGGERVAYVRMFSGALRVRELVQLSRESAQKVTAIGVFADGAVVPSAILSAGQIGLVRGLGEVRIGDSIGLRPPYSVEHFPPPTLETIVDPVHPWEKGKLHVALTEIADQDPLINLRQDDLRQEISVSLYGEVQKEVIQSTLATDYGLAVSFRTTTPICVERPIGTGAQVELIGVAPNPFRATVGLRIDPAPIGSGVLYRLEVEFGSMPLAHFVALEQTVHEVLRQGLYGWQVTDCVVTVTHTAFKPPPSSVGDVRNLTPLVLMQALARAGTVVCQPIDGFRLEVPGDTVGAVLPLLSRLGGVAQETSWRAGVCVLEGTIPAATVHELQQLLPGQTHGQALLEYAFAHHRPMPGRPATRPRTDNNPLNRDEYLLRVVRRVTSDGP